MTNPFGIYVHIPFCTHRCSYCDFYSFTKFGHSDFERLAGRLRGELADASRWLRSEGRLTSEAVSVFFGGGTPSLFPVELLASVWEAIATTFPVGETAEITLEANPETVSDSFCRELRARTAVNRISLGAQSFHPDNLAKLERLGSPESIVQATRSLRRSGFENFSLDLIFGIPGQGKPGLLFDLEAAIGLEPKHLSFYNLTLKPAHPLFKQLPGNDEAADLYEAGCEKLRAEGYVQYEISNFARPGFESRHNLLYWDGGDYLGIGPSAASRFFWEGSFHHRKQLSDFNQYLLQAGFPVPIFESSNQSQTILEASFLELRKNRGVHLETFHARYGYDLAGARKFSLFLKEGLVERAGSYLRLSEKGRLLADSVTRDLVDV